MGGWYSKILSSLFGEKDIRILILGLDGAGKTTILYRLSIGEVVDTVPTIGFNVETVSYKNLTFNVWDLGGQSTIRPYWRCYYADTGAVIYVVDAADVDRVGIAGDELGAMLGEEELKDVPLLVFANKQDQDGALAAQDVATRLGLHLLKDRDWRIVGCSAVKGKGLNEGLDWLVNVMKRGAA